MTCINQSDEMRESQGSDTLQSAAYLDVLDSYITG